MIGKKFKEIFPVYEINIIQMMMSSFYRCRKCRARLFGEESLITIHHESITTETSSTNECWQKLSNILFIDEQNMDNWIREQIDSGEWTKGRLICPTVRCLARVGSFNFINGEFCHCGQYQLPSIQFNMAKLDKSLSLSS